MARPRLFLPAQLPLLTQASLRRSRTTLASLVQIEQEIVEVTGTNTDGSSIVTRGAQGTPAAAHATALPAYQLGENVVIVPFIKNFFGNPASGDWQYSVTLPGVQLASACFFYMTNSLGAGAVTVNPYTGTIDSGLRTLAGGQYSFQLSGYLAIQTSAAPAVIVDADRCVRDLYAIVNTPPTGAAIAAVNRNGASYATVQIPDGAAISNIQGGFGLPALRAGDVLSLNITGVGATVPGSDLTLIMRAYDFRTN